MVNLNIWQLTESIRVLQSPDDRLSSRIEVCSVWKKSILKDKKQGWNATHNTTEPVLDGQKKGKNPDKQDLGFEFKIQRKN